MPYKSDAQRRFMWSQHPEIARRWANEGEDKVASQPNFKPGVTKANNAPVGGAGQPDKKSAKMNAIGRRVAARRKMDNGSKN